MFFTLRKSSYFKNSSDAQKVLRSGKILLFEIIFWEFKVVLELLPLYRMGKTCLFYLLTIYFKKADTTTDQYTVHNYTVYISHTVYVNYIWYIDIYVVALWEVGYHQSLGCFKNWVQAEVKLQQRKTFSSFSPHSHTRRIQVPLFPAHHQLFSFTPNSCASPAEEHGNCSGPGGHLGL